MGLTAHTRRFIDRGFCVAVGILLWIGVAQAQVIDGELASRLAASPDSVEFRVIANLKSKVDLRSLKTQASTARGHRLKLVRALRDNALATQPSVRNFLKRRGVTRIESLWLVNAFVLIARKPAILALRHETSIESIRLDAAVKAPVPLAGQASPAEWNLAQVDAPALWMQGITGAGVVTAILDTGADINHADIGGKWRGGSNSWFDPFGEHTMPYDAAGHGTQALGIVLGGTSTGSAIGMAPSARWIAGRLFDDRGQSSLSVIHKAFQWVLDPDNDPSTDDSPDVVNGSWGLVDGAGLCVREFEADVEALKAADIAVVFSAGNDGPQAETSLSPANYKESLSTGAVDGTSTIALTSSRGPSACDGSLYPRVVAPGVDIKTSDLSLGGVTPDAYTYVSGTSFAAPHVTGLIALLKCAEPSAAVTQIEAALEAASVDLGAPGPDDAYGHGLIKAGAALRSLRAALAFTPTPPPTPTNTAAAAPTRTPTVTPTIAAVSTLPAAPTGTPTRTAPSTTPAMTATPVTETSPAAAPESTPTQTGTPFTRFTCIDKDKDGFFSSDACGTAVDCDDNNESIFPGTHEIRLDKIDQDCNGYDLTIRVKKSVYYPKLKLLLLAASSKRGSTAALMADGFGKMQWKARLKEWHLKVRNTTGRRNVLIRGPEGNLRARVRYAAFAR